MEDLTIEDEFDLGDSPPVQSHRQSLVQNSFFGSDFLAQHWLVIVILSSAVLVIVSLIRTRQRARDQRIGQAANESDVRRRTSEDPTTRFDHMERVREQQQKRYQEQALLHAQQKKEKPQPQKSAAEESSPRSNYRTNDHNPLTGQSSRSSGDSCSWRPSSRRRPAGG